VIVCDNFVFLHLHKSGGTYVNQMLLTCIPSARRIGYHLPYSQLPEPFRALPVVGTVRNPWAYYVSWYHFQRGQARPNPLFQVCSNGGTGDFATTLTNLATLEANPDRVRQLADAFPETFVNYGLNLTRNCIAAISGSGLGFYSFLHDRLYAGAASPNILKMETLRQQLPTIGSNLGAADTIALHRFLRTTPNLNTSQHGPYQSYYSTEMQSLVAEMDRGVIAAHGYQFEVNTRP
jgi:hypothetical protein